MTRLSAPAKENARAPPAPGADAWLTFAASPTFALMAWIATKAAAPVAFCSSETMPPIGSMTAMYLLMSFFHLPPWLRFVSRRPGHVS